MRIVRGDAADRSTSAACFEIVRAADAVDETTGGPHGWCFLYRLPAELRSDAT